MMAPEATKAGCCRRRRRRHPRRPRGFGLWTLAAAACLPAAAAFLSAYGALAWALAAVFVACILWHYLRLATARKRLTRTVVTGAGLLTLTFWIYIFATERPRLMNLGEQFPVVVGLSAFTAFLALGGLLDCGFDRSRALAATGTRLWQRKLLPPASSGGGTQTGTSH